MRAAENFTDTAQGTKINFMTTPIGSVGTPLTRMTIGANGNVGVGTTSPGALLHVAGSMGAPSLSADAGIVMIADKNGVGPLGLNIGRDISSPYSVWLQTKRVANDGSVWPLTLNPLGGNVGIGTTSPAAALDVAGNINLSGTINQEAWVAPTFQNSWVN
jgi:hypothetical protein